MKPTRFFRGLGVTATQTETSTAAPAPAPAPAPQPVIVGGVVAIPASGPPTAPINLDNLQFGGGGSVASPEFQQGLEQMQQESQAQADALQTSYDKAQQTIVQAQASIADAVAAGRITAEEAPQLPSLAPLWVYEVGRVYKNYGFESLFAAIQGDYFYKFPGYDPTAQIFAGRSLNEIVVRYQALQDSGGLEDLIKYQGNEFDNIWHSWEENPERVFLGINTPLEAALWSRILNKDYDATVNMYGGDTEKDYKTMQEDDPGAANIGHAAHVMAQAVAKSFASGYAGQEMSDLGIFDTSYSMDDTGGNVDGSGYGSDFDAAAFEGFDTYAFESIPADFYVEDFPAIGEEFISPVEPVAPAEISISEEFISPVEPSDAAIASQQSSFYDPYDMGADAEPMMPPAQFDMPAAFSESPETLESWGLQETYPGSGVWEPQSNYSGRFSDAIETVGAKIRDMFLNRLFADLTGQLWRYVVGDDNPNVLQPTRVSSFQAGMQISPVPGGGQPRPIVLQSRSVTTRGGTGVGAKLSAGKIGDILKEAGIPAAAMFAGFMLLSGPRGSRRSRRKASRRYTRRAH